MRRAGTILCIFLLGVLVGSVCIVPGAGDADWIMGDLKPIADRLHVGERFEGYHVADILNAMADRLMACCPNVAPTAVDDVGTAAPGGTTYIEVLQNDTDLDRDSLTVVNAFAPDYGQAEVSHNMVKYIAPAQRCGWDSLEYEVSDSRGNTARAKVAVMIEWSPLISEVEMNPAHSDADSEWVELYNPSNSRVDLDGWQISVTSGCTSGEKTCWYDLPNDAFIEAWGRYVCTFDGIRLHDTNGWKIALRDPDGTIVSETGAGMEDTIDNYKTWQRIPDGSLLDSAWTYSNETPGAANE